VVDVKATRMLRGGDANKREFRLDVLMEWFIRNGVMKREDFNGDVEDLGESEEVINLSEASCHATRKMKVRAKRADAELHD
jgi:hypothetical protein